MNDSHLHQPIGVFMKEASNVYACADVIKDWFEAQIDAWIDAPAVRRQTSRSRWWSTTSSRVHTGSSIGNMWDGRFCLDIKFQAS